MKKSCALLNISCLLISLLSAIFHLSDFLYVPHHTQHTHARHVYTNTNNLSHVSVR